MAGVLLIFMIFVMLASERRSEMGMARAIGMQRGHLIQMFVTEGMLYDLLAALVGMVLGLGVSYLMIGFLGGLFNERQQTVQRTRALFPVPVPPPRSPRSSCLLPGCAFHLCRGHRSSPTR